MENKDLKECKERLDEIKDEMKTIVDAASNESRELTQDEQIKLDELQTEKENLIDLILELTGKIEKSALLKCNVRVSMFTESVSF